ncbi:hypothetical protein LBYZC6_02930 [Lacrimispora brassicae]
MKINERINQYIKKCWEWKTLSFSTVMRTWKFVFLKLTNYVGKLIDEYIEDLAGGTNLYIRKKRWNRIKTFNYPTWLSIWDNRNCY